MGSPGAAPLRLALVLATLAVTSSACTLKIPGPEEFACSAGGPCDGGPVEVKDGATDGGDAAGDAAVDPRDGGVLDADGGDAGRTDAAQPDAATRDAGATDATPLDAQVTPDSGPRDGGAGDGGCADGLIECGGGCHPADECTPCALGSQCPSGQCHPLLLRCVPPGRRALCEPCTTGAECGLEEDRCVILNGRDGGTLESACGQHCTANIDCPRGYDCLSNIGQCYPRAGNTTHTCAAVRDMLTRRACDPASSADQCGVAAYSDGECHPIIPECVIDCWTNDDCPVGSTCNDLIVVRYCLGN